MEDKCEIIEKQISISEICAYNLLHELNLDSIMIPYVLHGDRLEMAKGTHPSRLELDFVKLYTQVLCKMYKVKSTEFTPGIYSFFYGSNEKNDSTEKQLYLEHIVEIHKKFFHNCGEKINPLVEQTYLESTSCFIKWCEENMDTFSPEYVLLHGDLFIGNILSYRGEYKLIDPEFIRFGPNILELSFLLCWDFISNPTLRAYSSYIVFKNIGELLENKIIKQGDVESIINGFIPMIVSLVSVAASANLYKDSGIILDGCNSLWNNFKEKILNK